VSEYKWEKLKGKRLLLTDTITRIQRNEWTLLEISPNGKVGKFRNELANTRFWTDLDDFIVMDVLPAMCKEDGKLSDEEREYLDDTIRSLNNQLVDALRERDEARRSCCEFAAIVDGADTKDGMESGRFYNIAMKYMKSRGWDCFKEDGK
jgi:hypothetical protein